MAKNKRVVITGLGVTSAIGTGKDKFWKALIRGQDGISDIKSFDTSLYRTHKGGEVKDFKPDNFIKNIKLPWYCRSALLAMAAARLAVEDSGISEDYLASLKDAIGVIIGSTSAEPRLGERHLFIWKKKGYKGTPVRSIVNQDWAAVGAANSVCRELGVSGLALAIPAACAAGNYSIGYAYDLIKSGRLKVMLAGGTDSMNQLVFAGFNRLMAVDPEKCRPFDLKRKGLIVSEGAGIVVMESLEHALKRKAHIQAEVLGYGVGCEAYHFTGLHPKGLGIKRAMNMALGEAGITTEDIDYINAHGTATPLNDRIETLAMKYIFGKRAKKIPISSIKSMIGHPMGAASAIEAVACALVVKHDIIPPTINYRFPDPECDLDYVPNKSRRHKVKIALSNSFGFGGNIGLLLIGKYNE